MSTKLSSLIQPDKSDSSSQPNRKLQIFIVAVIAVLVFGGAQLLNYAPGRKYVAEAQAAAPTQEPSSGVIVVTATPTNTPEPTATERVVFRDSEPVTIEVTREVVREVERPVYYEVPIEVEVTREVQTILEVTPTPIPLADGVVRVCVDASGVRELYVAGVGVVGGGCRELVVGVGATQITVQVNR